MCGICFAAGIVGSDALWLFWQEQQQGSGQHMPAHADTLDQALATQQAEMASLRSQMSGLRQELMHAARSSGQAGQPAQSTRVHSLEHSKRSEYSLHVHLEVCVRC